MGSMSRGVQGIPVGMLSASPEDAVVLMYGCNFVAMKRRDYEIS